MHCEKKTKASTLWSKVSAISSYLEKTEKVESNRPVVLKQLVPHIQLILKKNIKRKKC